MRGGIPIGRIFGISVRLHYSWFFIFALITWALAANYFPTTYPAGTTSESIAAGVITSFLFFGSVLAHELMHSVVANRQGLPVHNITLFIFGGVSELTKEPASSRDEFWMALVGPLTSVVLGFIFYGISLETRGTSLFVAAVTYWLAQINILLGVFNLIPGFPLDGGRVLRSIIWWRTNNLRQATRIASGVGRVIGFLFIIGGIFWIFRGDVFNGLWIAFIGWFLENAALSSYRQMAIEEVLRGHVAREIMTTDCTTISPDVTIEKLVNDYILASGRRCFPIVDGGRIEGLVTIHNARAVPRDRWGTTKTRDVMTPLANLKSVSPGEDLFKVLQIMASSDVNQVPVVEGSNIVGMVGRDNLISFINVRSELGR